ncbi:MAG: NAD(P)/FAD-dependent oxidoreductase [Candidatus Nanopelagicales bacterium]
MELGFTNCLLILDLLRHFEIGYITKRIAVIGAGVSGISAANTLVDAGYSVTLFDQGKSLGGRLGIRTLKVPPYQGRNIDVGAAYFTASEEDFKLKVEEWLRQKLAHQWVDTFSVIDEDGISNKSGPMRYVASGGLKNLLFFEMAILKDKIDYFQDYKVTEVDINNKVRVDKKQFDAVVLALPAPQAGRIVLNSEIKSELSKIKFNPVLVSWFSSNIDLAFDGMFVNNSSAVNLLINEGSKQRDNNNICTIYSTHEFAAAEINDLDLAKEKLLNEANKILNINSSYLESGIMRWTLAQPVSSERPKMPSNVAIVGDAFSDNPRIEAAWLDGSRVLEQLA